MCVFPRQSRYGSLYVHTYVLRTWCSRYPAPSRDLVSSKSKIVTTDQGILGLGEKNRNTLCTDLSVLCTDSREAIPFPSHPCSQPSRTVQHWLELHLADERGRLPFPFPFLPGPCLGPRSPEQPVVVLVNQKKKKNPSLLSSSPPRPVPPWRLGPCRLADQ